MTNNRPELLRDIITRVMDVLNQRRCNMCDNFDDFEDDFDGDFIDGEFEDDYDEDHEEFDIEESVNRVSGDLKLYQYWRLEDAVFSS